MLVQVLETGPDGTQTVIWDTNKLRALGTEENDDEIMVNFVWFADYLESDAEALNDSILEKALPFEDCTCCDYSYSYCGIELEGEKGNTYSKSFTLYLD